MFCSIHQVWSRTVKKIVVNHQRSDLVSFGSYSQKSKMLVQLHRLIHCNDNKSSLSNVLLLKCLNNAFLNHVKSISSKTNSNNGNHQTRKEWRDRYKRNKEEEESKQKITANSNMTNHYDSLEISPESSQKEIKTAYYEATKKYHPDINASEEAKVKFKEVSDAYDVLGSKKSRENYDLKLFGRKLRKQNFRQFEEDPMHWRSEEDEKRARGFTRQKREQPTGKTEEYDYSEYYKMHYEEFKRKEDRLKKEEMEKEQEAFRLSLQAAKKKILVVANIILFLGCVMIVDEFVREKHEKNLKEKYERRTRR